MKHPDLWCPHCNQKLVSIYLMTQQDPIMESWRHFCKDCGPIKVEDAREKRFSLYDEGLCPVCGVDLQPMHVITDTQPRRAEYWYICKEHGTFKTGEFPLKEDSPE